MSWARFFSLARKRVGGKGGCHCVEAFFFYYILYSLLALHHFFLFPSFLVLLVFKGGNGHAEWWTDGWRWAGG